VSVKLCEQISGSLTSGSDSSRGYGVVKSLSSSIAMDTYISTVNKLILNGQVPLDPYALSDDGTQMSTEVLTC
jgi:hypothetical protein